MSDHVLTDTTFPSFDLHPSLAQGLADCGFTRCTPIQELTLPVALAGRDVAGQAQTGTGKTCAFLVATMNHLLTHASPESRKSGDPRALIVAPTRELAIQIDKDARAIGGHTGLATALVYGGVDYDKQRQKLREGCDIMIATPGRMLDYYKQHVFGMGSVEVMVIDEADRMFDLGFIKDVRYIFRRLPPREQRQVLLYSATLSRRVLELAYEHMDEAEKLVVETEAVTADKVRQKVYFPAKEEKLPLLLNLLRQEKPERTLVFVNTRAQTDRVRKNLHHHGYRVGALSGDVPQVKRQKVLQRFADGQLQALVCTDVAARGLHIPDVSHVFNYDLPQDAEDYVHRIGRTARLGEEGDAISFACDLYAISLPDIESFIDQKIPVADIEPAMLVMPEAPAKPADDAEATGPRGEASRSGQRRRRRRRSSGQRQGAASQNQAGSTHTSGGRAEASSSSQEGQRASEHTTGHEAAPRKRRRRRGGRNRNRNRGNQPRPAESQGGASQGHGASSSRRADGARASGAKDASPRAEHGSGQGAHGRKPSRHQGDTARHRADAASRSAATTPKSPGSGKARSDSADTVGKSTRSTPRPGFFKRVAKGLFGGNA